ncbi:MAG: efflux RND transporter permease subunit [Pseudomonadota bacterium]|nr:efflux RND transporter permease subunit [Pseudomonadota bacterium]MEC8633780.1 efflux RND transporter permease subunit [Pseudomonadota bacterium]
MPKLITWFVDNPVAANLLMFILIFSGLLALNDVRKEEFPNVEAPVIMVTVPYLGAAPAEVETGVCARIEESIDGIENIVKVKTTAAEGQCSVAIELEMDSDKAKALDDIKAQVSAISTFPANTERPIVSQVTMRSLVAQIAVHGDTDERSLKNITESIRKDLLELPEVSLVETLYMRADEISIEIPEATLRRHQLTLDQVAHAIRSSSIDIPGGSVRADAGEIRLRSTGQRYTGKELENVVVAREPGGGRLLLRDIATIVDGFEDVDQYGEFNGEQAMMIQISRIGSDDAIEISEAVVTYVESKERELPERVHFTMWSNEADELVGRLGTMINNAVGGLLLVIISLSLFLRVRLALWVSAGIPVAIFGALAFFPSTGLSISTLSLMGLLLSLGVVVDDAIVVGERIYTKEQEGLDPRTAAILGTSDVAVPVFFGVLTTIAAFMPLLNVDSNLGQFFVSIGGTVVLCLMFSIVESQLILPSHLAHRSQKRRQSGFSQRWERFQDRIAGSLQRFATNRYNQWIEWGIDNRYTTLSIALAMMIIMGGLMASGRVVFQFFPAVAGNNVVARVVMPEGYPLAGTQAVIEKIQASAAETRRKVDAQRDDGKSAFKNELSSIGVGITQGAIVMAGATGSNVAEVSLNLVPYRERGGMTPQQVVNLWRDLTPPIPDVVELSFSADAVSMGADIDLELRGRDIEQLGRAANSLTDTLAGYSGLYDISNSHRSGKRELALKVLPEAEALGLTQADLGNQVRDAFYGREALRVQRGRDDVRVMVRFPMDDRRSLASLETMTIRLPDGTEVPALSVAEITPKLGKSTINRTDGQRTINVVASANREVTPPETILAEMFKKHVPRLMEDFPGVTVSQAGEAEERARALSGLVSASLIALMVIYTLLAIPLKSYLQPLVVMASIPFGFIGAILGHQIMNYDLVFFSLLGMIALAGVVINSSLVLVDFINRNRRLHGMGLREAVIDSGMSRFRPIFLTSVTTFMGLMPLMVTRDFDTAPFVPLAVSLGFGVVFSTAVTLMLIPALYVILEDFLSVFRDDAESNIEPEETALRAQS